MVSLNDIPDECHCEYMSMDESKSENPSTECARYVMPLARFILSYESTTDLV